MPLPWSLDASASPPSGDSPTARLSGLPRPGGGAGRTPLCAFQQLGQRHSTARVPSVSTRRVSRHPKVALMSV